MFRKEGFFKSKTYEASDEARASFLAESRAEGLVYFLPNPEDEATEIENMRFDTLPSPKQHRWHVFDFPSNWLVKTRRSAEKE